MVSLVIYKCLFGRNEHDNPAPVTDDSSVDLICFTDDPDLRSSVWDVRLVQEDLIDAARQAKKIKQLPHRYLGKYAASMYIDNTITLREKPSAYFDLLDNSESGHLAFRHPDRDCVYDEADAVLELGYDDPDRVREQIYIYRAAGYPEHHGLTTCTVMLRRHNDPSLVRVNEDWREQVLRYSKRDQLSLHVMFWKHGYTPGVIDMHIMDNELVEWNNVIPGRGPRHVAEKPWLIPPGQ